jgi:hypothetical protein
MQIISARPCSCVPIYIWLVAVALLMGCGKRAGGPATVEVAGTVTFDEKPVEGANVTFSPEGTGDDARLASQALTDQNGRFQLSTYVGSGKTKSGIIPGRYQVTVSKFDRAALGKGFVAPTNVLPKKYGDAKTSQLRADVAAGKENDFPFALKGE